MVVADGLGPDVLHTDVDEGSSGEDRRLDPGTDGDDGDIELGGAELAEHFRVGGVGLADMGESGRPFLHQAGVEVDRHHFGAQLDQGFGQR